MMISVGIVEDEEDIRNDLMVYFNRQTDLICPVAVPSVEDFIRAIRQKPIPDIILMDIQLPGMSGLEGIRLIKADYPDTEIIMLTIYDDTEKIFKALMAGASGYLLKNTSLPKIREAILELKTGGAPMNPQIARKVIEYFNPERQAKKESPLTDREKEIVIGLVDGLSYQAIGNRMGITIETVRSYIKSIYRKLQVNSKSEVIRKSLQGEI
ncbi:MAG: response regulator transcription factor [Bacteroidetes bacterium]|nr:response regulator transcription factor [Bacteroidota bacterium]